MLKTWGCRRCGSSPCWVEPLRYTELQISSELLDQPESAGQPKKIFICSTPRSGSYLLCRYMINAGLGIPHEYFNPIVMRQMAPRLGLESDIRGLTWSPHGWKDRLLFRHRRGRAAELAFLGKYLRFPTGTPMSGRRLRRKGTFQGFPQDAKQFHRRCLAREHTVHPTLPRRHPETGGVGALWPIDGSVGNRRLGHHDSGRKPQFLRPWSGRPGPG